MERLTYVKKPSQFDRGKHPTKYTSRHTFQEVVARLAAYEDTGLGPETLNEFAPFLLEMKMNLGAMRRLKELAQAEKDGRLVVLPCKPGQIIYRKCWIKVGVAAVDAPGIEWIYKNRELFGKEFFLTREEAEAALKKREEADNEVD